MVLKRDSNNIFMLLVNEKLESFQLWMKVDAHLFWDEWEGKCVGKR